MDPVQQVPEPKQETVEPVKLEGEQPPQQKQHQQKQGKKNNKEKLQMKAAKGTRDFLPLQMAIRRHVFGVIEGVFQQHGAVEIDTPVFELKETLLGKYGEEGGKLVYDVDDQGGEILSLRYDLTVPFARFVATHGIKKIKRYHIGKVYRRDNPSIQQGRFREFFQCDFDIAGDNDPMVADAELIRIIDQIFTKLDMGQFTIKVSNRKLLDAMIQIAGIPTENFKQVCSTIDKLDKSPWKEVEKELIEKKGVSKESCEILQKMVLLKGEPFQLLKKIEDEKIFEGNQLGLEGLQEMKQLFNYVMYMNGIKHVIFDLSLARGLDYYTGMIQETVLHGTQVGSVSGGGRYDHLIGMFSNVPVPSVGASIGIERVFAILEKKFHDDPLIEVRENPSECIIATIPSKNMDMTAEKMKLCDILWEAGFKCDFNYKLNWNLGKQLTYANDQKIPFAIVIGEDEVKQNIVKLKSLNDKKEESVPLAQLAQVLRQRINESNVSQIQIKKPQIQEEVKQQ